MEEFKIYSVSDQYIEYLRQFEPNVYSNKSGNRSHTRKYIGTVIEMNGVKYFVPMSSPSFQAGHNVLHFLCLGDAENIMI